MLSELTTIRQEVLETFFLFSVIYFSGRYSPKDHFVNCKGDYFSLPIVTYYSD